jgi:hypothetical protein
MRKLRSKSLNTFQINTTSGNYLVTLERIKNTTSGNPRFEATIIDLNSYCFATYKYTFQGHFMSENDEAQWIAERHEKESM